MVGGWCEHVYSQRHRNGDLRRAAHYTGLGEECRDCCLIIDQPGHQGAPPGSADMGSMPVSVLLSRHGYRSTAGMGRVRPAQGFQVTQAGLVVTVVRQVIHDLDKAGWLHTQIVDCVVK